MTCVARVSYCLENSHIRFTMGNHSRLIKGNRISGVAINIVCTLLALRLDVQLISFSCFSLLFAKCNVVDMFSARLIIETLNTKGVTSATTQKDLHR